MHPFAVPRAYQRLSSVHRRHQRATVVEADGEEGQVGEEVGQRIVTGKATATRAPQRIDVQAIDRLGHIEP